MRDGIINKFSRKSQLVQAVVLINVFTFLMGMLPVLPGSIAQASPEPATASPLLALPLTPDDMPDRGRLTLESSMFEVSPKLQKSAFFDRYLDQEETLKKAKKENKQPEETPVYKTRKIPVGGDPYIILLTYAKFTLIQIINMTRSHLDYGEDFFGDDAVLERARLQPTVQNLKEVSFPPDKFPDMNTRFNNLLRPQVASDGQPDTRVPLNKNSAQRDGLLIDMMIQALQIWAIDRELALSKSDAATHPQSTKVTSDPQAIMEMQQLQSALMLNGTFRILSSPIRLEDMSERDLAYFKAQVNSSALRGILKEVQGFRDPGRRGFDVPFLYELLVALAIYYYLDAGEEAKGLINLKSNRFSSADEYSVRDLLYHVSIAELRAQLMEKKVRIKSIKTADAIAEQERGLVGALMILHKTAWYNTLAVLKTAMIYLSRRSNFSYFERIAAMAKIWPLDQGLQNATLSPRDGQEPDDPEEMWKWLIDIIPLFKSPALQQQVEDEMGISVASQAANIDYFMDYHDQYYKSIAARQESVHQTLRYSLVAQALVLVAPSAWIAVTLLIGNTLLTSQSIALNYFASQGAIPGLYSALFYNFASSEVFEMPGDIEARSIDMLESLGDWKFLVSMIGVEAVAAVVLNYWSKARQLKDDTLRLRAEMMDENLSTIKGFRGTYNSAYSPVAWVQSSSFRRAYVEGRFAMFNDTLADLRRLDFVGKEADLAEWLGRFKAKFPKHYSFYREQWKDAVKAAEVAKQSPPTLDRYIEDVLRNRNGCTLNGADDPYYCFCEVEANGVAKPWRAQDRKDITGTVLKDTDAATSGLQRHWDALADRTRVDARYYARWGKFIDDHNLAALLADDANELRGALNLASQANGDTTAFGNMYSQFRARRELAKRFDDMGIGVKSKGWIGKIRNAWREATGLRPDVVNFSRLAAAKNYDAAAVKSVITKLDDGQNLELWGFGQNSRRGRYPVQVLIRGARAISDRLPTGSGVSLTDRWGNYLLTHHLEIERLGLAGERIARFSLIRLPLSALQKMYGSGSDARAVLTKLGLGVLIFGNMAEKTKRGDKMGVASFNGSPLPWNWEYGDENDQVALNNLTSMAKVILFTGLERGGFTLRESMIQSARLGAGLSLGTSLGMGLISQDSATFSEEAYAIYSRSCADMLYCSTLSLGKGFGFETLRDASVGIGGKRSNPWMLLPLGLIEFGNKYTGSLMWSSGTQNGQGLLDQWANKLYHNANGNEEVVIALRTSGNMERWDRFAGYPIWSKVVIVDPAANAADRGESTIQALLKTLDTSLPDQVANLEMPIDLSEPVVDLKEVQSNFEGLDFFDQPEIANALAAAQQTEENAASDIDPIATMSLEETISQAVAMNPGKVNVNNRSIPVLRYRQTDSVATQSITNDWREVLPKLQGTRLFQTAVSRLVEIYDNEGELERVYVIGKDDQGADQELMTFGWGALHLPHKLTQLYVEDVRKEALHLGRNGRKADVVARLYLDPDSNGVPQPLQSGSVIPAKKNLSLHYLAYQQCLQQGARPSKLDRATKIRLNYLPFPADSPNRKPTDYYFDSFEVLGDRSEDEVLAHVDWKSEYITPCDPNWHI